MVNATYSLIEPCEPTQTGFVAFRELSADETEILYDEIAYKRIYFEKNKYHVLIRYTDIFK